MVSRFLDACKVGALCFPRFDLLPIAEGWRDGSSHTDFFETLEWMLVKDRKIIEEGALLLFEYLQSHPYVVEEPVSQDCKLTLTNADQKRSPIESSGMKWMALAMTVEAIVQTATISYTAIAVGGVGTKTVARSGMSQRTAGTAMIVRSRKASPLRIKAPLLWLKVVLMLLVNASSSSQNVS